MVERGRRRRPYKTCGEAATTNLGLKGRQTYKPSGPTGRSILRTFPSEPYEPGLRSGPSSRPLPSRCARHPPPGRGWAGTMEEKNVASNPAYPILWGGERRPRPSNLPPTARRGEGDHEVVEGGADWRHYKKLRRSRHHHLLNPGRGAAHPAAPFRLAALATHPREGGGQVTWRRGTLPSNPAYPILWGKGDHALQTCLPPLVGERGTTKWWRGAAEGGIIKTAAKPPPPPSAQKAVKLKNPWAQAHSS